MDTYDIEEIILGMADIVRENRILRYELQETRKQLENSKKHIADLHKGIEEGQNSFLEALMNGVFCTKEERKRLEELKEVV